MMRVWVSAAVSLFMSGFAYVSPHVPSYRVRVLPNLPDGDFSMAMGLNNKEQVVGLSSIGKVKPMDIMRDTRAVLWQDGKVIDLIGKAKPCPEAFKITDSGQVLIQPQVVGGLRPVPIPPPMPYVVLWDHGIKRTWDKWNGFFPYGLNSKGLYVGFRLNQATQSSFRGERLLAISFPHEVSHARAVNDAGLIGGSYQHGDISRGFILANGRVIDPAPWAAEAFWGVTAINQSGLAAEAARGADWHTHLILWQAGKTRDLTELGRYGSISGINEQGDIVGDAEGKPFLYKNGRLYLARELVNRARIEIESFTGINNAGQISGSAEINGQQRAIVLDPVK